MTIGATEQTSNKVYWLPVWPRCLKVETFSTTHDLESDFNG
jgi:hypothetical protein